MQQSRWEVAAGPINSEISSRVILASGDALVNRRAISQRGRIRPSDHQDRAGPKEHGNGGEQKESQRRKTGKISTMRGRVTIAGVGHRTVGAGSYARHSQEIYVPKA